MKKVSKMKKLRSAEKLLLNRYDVEHLKRISMYDRVMLKRARYWCYRIQNEVTGGAEANPPRGFKEFIEGLENFGGWKQFAITWDLAGHNPFMVVHRLTSVWQDWEHVMDRVAIPIDATPEEARRRQELLARQYKG